LQNIFGGLPIVRNRQGCMKHLKPVLVVQTSEGVKVTLTQTLDQFTVG
jgi:hypothetical protein